MRLQMESSICIQKGEKSDLVEFMVAIFKGNIGPISNDVTAWYPMSIKGHLEVILNLSRTTSEGREIRLG